MSLTRRSFFGALAVMPFAAKALATSDGFIRSELKDSHIPGGDVRVLYHRDYMITLPNEVWRNHKEIVRQIESRAKDGVSMRKMYPKNKRPDWMHDVFSVPISLGNATWVRDDDALLDMASPHFYRATIFFKC